MNHDMIGTQFPLPSTCNFILVGLSMPPPTFDDISSYPDHSPQSPLSLQDSNTGEPVATALTDGNCDKRCEFTNILFEDDTENQ